VLVVDNDASMAAAIQADDRFETKLVGDVFAAGMAAADFLPHVIVADHGVAGLTPTTCKTIRETAQFEKVKIVAVGDTADTNEVNTLLKAGADEFVKTPFDINKFIDRIAELPAGII
jgi:DNA-binding response OmpR family regulator